MITFTLTSAEDTVAIARAHERIKAVEDAVTANGQNTKTFEIKNFSGIYTADVRVANKPPARAKRAGRG